MGAGRWWTVWVRLAMVYRGGSRVSVHGWVGGRHSRIMYEYRTL